MIALAIISLCITWYILGAVGFIYWWTKDFDFKTSHLLTALVCGLIGPLSWIVGYIIHSDRVNKPKIIIKKRDTNL